MNQEKTYEMNYRLNSGMVCTIQLTQQDALNWVECFQENKKFIPKHGNIAGINPNLVATFNFPLLEYENALNEVSPDNTEQAEDQSKVDELQLAESRKRHGIAEGQAPFKVTCQCRAIYVVTTSDTISTFKCKYCQREVRRIYEAGLIETRFGLGYLLSNL